MNSKAQSTDSANRATVRFIHASLVLACSSAGFWTRPAYAAPAVPAAGNYGVPYPNMPNIAPRGVRIGKYQRVPESAMGPAIDPAEGFRLERLRGGMYMITDNIYQSLFMTYESGVIVIDAPPSYAKSIIKAIRSVTDKPITHLIYSHAHSDHIGGASLLGGSPIIIAHEETQKLLLRANDPHRPKPTVVFQDRYTLKAGTQVLELSYHGNAHLPGNIFIEAQAHKILMVVDVVYPGWMPWREFALARDLTGYFAQVEEIDRMQWETLVSGHVQRTGTHEDVKVQLEFMNDLRNAASAAMKSTKLGEGLDPNDVTNPWAVYANYLDRVAIKCVNQLTPKWATRLAAYDAFIWDQCYAMEESLRTAE